MNATPMATARDATFSERFPILYEREGREKKAEKVLKVLRHVAGGPLHTMTTVDIGSSTGIMAEMFAREFRLVLALDVDSVALRFGRDLGNRRLHCVQASGTNAPVRTDSVDVVICNQVYEHVDDPAALLREILRMLKPGGICYFGAASRYGIIEPHYFLPFLSWLPPRIASLYLRLARGQKEYDVRLLSWSGVRKLLRDFDVTDLTPDILKNPQDFGAEDLVKPGSLPTRLPLGFHRLVSPALPAWVWIARKRAAS